jgi:signal transduction histidine kinase
MDNYPLTLAFAITGTMLVVFIIALVFDLEKQRALNSLNRKNETLNTVINQLRNAQQQLVQSEKMASLGQMMAGIAHEIKNPLNFVNNFSQLTLELIQEYKAATTAEEKAALLSDVMLNVERIHEHGKRADSIVKNMLQHARSGSFEKQPTNLHTLIRDYTSMALQNIRLHHHAFQCNVIHSGAQLSPVSISAQDVGRVIFNLCSNALYALHQKKEKLGEAFQPELKIETLLRPPFAVVRISDNGTGISEALLGKIFDPFFTTKPSRDGSGLGLSISYDIIKAHGGSLTATSKENEGAVFEFTLPASS